MKYLGIIICLFLGNQAFANIPDCSNLSGNWQGSIYDYDINSERTWYSSMKKDGTFKIEFEDNFGGEIKTRLESGGWYCDREYLHILTNEVDGEVSYYHDVYKLLALDSSYMRYQHMIADCMEYIEDYQGQIFEAVKVI